MGKVVVDERAIEAAAFDALVGDLVQIGAEGKAFCRRNTPRLSGYAQRSIFFVVLDERGNAIAGDTADDNGVPIPSYLPQQANGRIRAFVGANAPYYVWIEIGANGVAGHHALAQTADLLDARMRQAASERRPLGAR